MFRSLNHRASHYALLLTVGAALTLPNLGAPTLWDIDEGNNAEAAREMLEAGNWVVPTFDYHLRTDKPALLYWLQMIAYRIFGVGEFAARLPSALAALATILVTYELGRRLFGKLAGLLAGLVFVSSLAVCVSAHFANPDALLNLCSTSALTLVWISHVRKRGQAPAESACLNAPVSLGRSQSPFSHGGRGWFIPFGVVTGLGMLAKGPVALALPTAVIGVYLLWSRQLRVLLDRRLAWGVVAFVVVALPWYGWVGAETKGEFLQEFFGKHNVSRFSATMENHRGPFYYYPLVLLVGLAPWSVFLVPSVWYAIRETRRKGEEEARRPGEHLRLRFLWAWVGVYVIFFSFSSTKLPNYILPAYAALAILTARFLDRWRRGEIAPPAWIMQTGLVGLALIGIGMAAGLLAAGGVLTVPAMRGRPLPGVETWAVLGAVPVLGAAAASWCLWRRRHAALVACFSATAVLFLGTLAAWGGGSLNAFKAPQSLADSLPADQSAHEIRIAAYQYFQPSLVFYCHREVRRLEKEDEAVEFLRCPLRVYLFVPVAAWERLSAKVLGPTRIVGQQRDLYRNCDVVLVTNQ